MSDNKDNGQDIADSRLRRAYKDAEAFMNDYNNNKLVNEMYQIDRNDLMAFILERLGIHADAINTGIRPVAEVLLFNQYIENDTNIPVGQDGFTAARGIAAGVTVTVDPGSKLTFVSDLIGGMTDTQVASGTNAQLTTASNDIITSYSENVTLVMNGAVDQELRLRLDTVQVMPQYAKMNMLRVNTSELFIQADVGVMINGVDNAKLKVSNRWQGATLTRVSADVWVISGDVEVVV